MSFILVVLGVGIVIDMALNLWILKRLKKISKEQTCTWTINFGDGGLIIGEAEKQQEEEQEK